MCCLAAAAKAGAIKPAQNALLRDAMLGDLNRKEEGWWAWDTALT